MVDLAQFSVGLSVIAMQLNQPMGEKGCGLVVCGHFLTFPDQDEIVLFAKRRKFALGVQYDDRDLVE